MLKKIFNRLAVKVFVISFAVQILSGLLICFFLYSRTPEMLYSAKDELDDLIIEFKAVTKAEGGQLADDFIRRTGMQLAFFDQDTYATYRVNKPLDDVGTLTIKTIEDYRGAFEILDENQGDMGTYAVEFKDDPTDYLVQYFYDGKTTNLIPRAVANGYPMMILVVVSLALVSSLIYALLFARPVRKLSEVSKSMAKMDLSVRCKEGRGDEIGSLASDLNTMAAALDQKMKKLEEEIVRVKELESQKEMFFAAASHELKTPVTIVEGQLRGMIENVGPYQNHEGYLAKSLRTVKRMESLINEILTASRMQSAEEISVSDVDISEVIEQRINEAEDLFAIRNITVNKETDSGLFFKGNKDLTALAVGAFISNAVFYSKEGAAINISSHKEENEIVTLIENSEAHIDEKDIEHLFEPFYRPDAARNSRDGGSGLGLYLASLIITKQGGDCELYNTAGGVTAKIVLSST
ncbi:MAG: HAMP domain-containing histidine kinase [Eubacterium sp.]|nr:HAMP domain-containing histidine kinase [Eubacterium sp.]